MSRYEEEHPYRVKLFEIAVDSLIGLAGMALCTWLTQKFKDHEERVEEERECCEVKQQEEMASMMDRCLTATTLLTTKYGPKWMEVKTAVDGYNNFIEFGVFDNEELDLTMMEIDEE